MMKECMFPYVMLSTLILCLCVTTVNSQPRQTPQKADRNSKDMMATVTPNTQCMTSLVMELMDEVKILRQEMRDGFATLRKKFGPRKKKRQELIRKVDSCTAGVEQLRVLLIPTTTTTTTPTPSTLPATMTVCETGWLKHEEHCYLFSSRYLNWGDARNDCRNKGGQLVSINNQAEQDFLVEHVKNSIKSLWTGLIWVPEKLQWLDGTDVNFTAWGRDNPDCMDSGSCRTALSISYEWLWEDYRRASTARYICERNHTITVPYEASTTTTTTAAPVTPSYCPAGWVPFSGHCYLFELEKKSFQDASETCRGLNSYLMSINNQEEQDFLTQQLTKYFRKDDDYWVGMTYNSDRKQLTWQDGSDVTSTTRYPDQLEYCLKDGGCAASLAYYRYSWGIIIASGKLYFICEAPGFSK